MSKLKLKIHYVDDYEDKTAHCGMDLFSNINKLYSRNNSIVTCKHCLNKLARQKQYSADHRKDIT